SIYVFDSQEELNECCSRRITPNGILSLSVNNNLTSNTLTGLTPTRGVIKVVSSYPANSACDATAVRPQFGIKGWVTHVQVTTTGFSLTEEELINASFSEAEAADLAEDCAVLTELGSGRGICTGAVSHR